MLLSHPSTRLSGPQAPSSRSGARRRLACSPPRLHRSIAASQRNAPGSAQRGEADPTAMGLPPLKQVPYRAIAALAAAGLAETAYLTAMKLFSLTPACPLGGPGAGGGCGDILSSEYSVLFGVVPLSALGMLAYGGVAALALAGAAVVARGGSASTPAAASASAEPSPAAAEEEGEASASASTSAPAARQPSAWREAAETPFRQGVLAGSLALATTSSCLIYLLFTKFSGELCPWCLASAGLSYSIAALAASGFRPRELSEAAAPGAGAVVATLLVLSLGLGNPNLSFASGDYDLDYSQPQVTTTSGPGAVSLAERLAAAGARMYGAFWCSHCYDQKQLFGAEAMAAFPYVECYPEGLHKDTKMAAACEAAPGGLQGFPTWVVGGEQLVGDQSFEELEAALARQAAAAPAMAAS